MAFFFSYKKATQKKKKKKKKICNACFPVKGFSILPNTLITDLTASFIPTYQTSLALTLSLASCGNIHYSYQHYQPGKITLKLRC